MDELTHWTDGNPLERSFVISFHGYEEPAWRVVVKSKLDEHSHRYGEGRGHSLNFAAIKALIAWDETQVAP